MRLSLLSIQGNIEVGGWDRRPEVDVGGVVLFEDRARKGRQNQGLQLWRHAYSILACFLGEGRFVWQDMTGCACV